MFSPQLGTPDDLLGFFSYVLLDEFQRRSSFNGVLFLIALFLYLLVMLYSYPFFIYGP